MTYAAYKGYLEEPLVFERESLGSIITENSVDSKRRLGDLLSWMLDAVAGNAVINKDPTGRYFGLVLRTEEMVNETVEYLDESNVAVRINKIPKDFTNSERIAAVYHMPNAMRLVVGITER